MTEMKLDEEEIKEEIMNVVQADTYEHTNIRTYEQGIYKPVRE